MSILPFLFSDLLRILVYSADPVKLSHAITVHRHAFNHQHILLNEITNISLLACHFDHKTTVLSLRSWKWTVSGNPNLTSICRNQDGIRSFRLLIRSALPVRPLIRSAPYLVGNKKYFRKTRNETVLK